MNQDIFEGLKVAMGRGESLEEAMQTFYNSGYEKREIEEAARALQSWIKQEQIKGKTPDIIPIIQKPQPQRFKFDQFSLFPKKKKENEMIKNESLSSPEKPRVMVNKQPQKISQKVSGYEQQKPSKKKMILLVSLLIVIFGLILASLFFLREDILRFFNSIFQ